MNKQSLGRGLASLIPPKETALEKIKNVFVSEKAKESIFSIEIEKIKVNPQQPRSDFNDESIAELAASIRAHGVLQPLLVNKLEIDVSGGTRVEYELIAGERRLRASKLAGLRQVPAIIRRSPSDREKLELAIIENVQRQDLNTMERAFAYDKLMKDFGFSQKEVADKIGKSRESVANLVRLLALPVEVQKALKNGKIFEGHARTILAVQDSQKQIALFEDIMRQNLSVRQAEEISRRVSPVRLTRTVEHRKDPEVAEWENRLEESLGTKVSISKQGEKGRIVIGFYSQDELNNILDKIAD